MAVVREGEILVRHAWGYANAERRIAFTPATLFRICSITKQFTCGVLLDRFADPSVLDGDVAAHLPQLTAATPSLLHMAHNQSGLRDYWAVAMLHGAPAESAFGEGEAARVISGARSLQFTPGAAFSYCNQNFRITANILQTRTGRSFAELLRTSIFEPAGMHSAVLAAETRSLPDATQGYEGSVASGFRPAENNILWTGDAGIAASLDDMIAWEKWLDAGRDDPASLYQRLSGPVTFSDGAPAEYGFGLNRRLAFGRHYTAHGGALRGWRSHRLYVPQERLSVVVMFNHLSDAGAAAMHILAAALDAETPPAPADWPPRAWVGAYSEMETGLAARIAAEPGGKVRLQYGHWDETLDARQDGGAGTDGVRLSPEAGGLLMHRPGENRRSRLVPLAPATLAVDVAGRYHCSELEAVLTVADAGGALYGGFSGFLGQGRMERLHPIGADVWALPCPRALDHTPPGDWTLAFQRHGEMVRGVTVGCWLARGLRYDRV